MSRGIHQTAWASIWIVAALTIGVDSSQAQSAAPTPGTTATAPASGDAKAEQAPAKGPEAPAEETWLRSEDGQEYRLEKIEKAKCKYLKISGTTYRTQWGTLMVDREDDTYLYYRVYRQVEQEPVPSQESLLKQRTAEFRKLLPPPLAETDRLQGVDFGRGLPTVGQWRNSFEFADMNEDGFLDLVHGPERKGVRRPNIFLGNGKGDWRPWSQAKFPSQTYDYGDVSVGDFNGDHHLDLFLAAHLLGLEALLGDGKGGFIAANEGLPWRSRSSEPLGFSSQQVQAVNWDKDKRAQVLALSEGPKMSLTAGQLPAIAESVGGVRLYRITSKDPAKAVWEWVNPKDKSTTLFGQDLQLSPDRKSFVIGSGNMDAKDLVFEGRDGSGWLQTSLPFPPRSYFWSLAPLRRSGLATFDVVGAGLSFDAGMSLRLIDLYRRSGSGWERKTLWWEEQSSQGPVRVATGDLDGNGLDDVVALGASGQVWILLQEAGDNWVLEQSPELQGPAGCLGGGLRIQDLDKDGRPEVAISWAGEADPLLDPGACPGEGSLRVWKFNVRQPAGKK